MPYTMLEIPFVEFEGTSALRVENEQKMRANNNFICKSPKIVVPLQQITIKEQLAKSFPNMEENYRQLREYVGISQYQLAEKLGISQARLSAYELKKEYPSNQERLQIINCLSQLKDGTLEIRRKKRISKETFTSSIVSSRPRRSFKQTQRNEDYQKLLEQLDTEFHKDHTNGPKAISFFAGCGGLCYGITAAGFNIVAANELVEDYKKIYKLNFPNANFLTNDIRDISDEEVQKLKQTYPDIDLFAGGPPCQGFSLAGKRDVNDKRNTLFQYYLHIAKIIQPKIILMENVRLLTSMKDPNGNFVKDEIIKTFTEIGYDGQFFVLNASQYEVAQNRERVIFVGVRKDLHMKPSMLTPLCGKSTSTPSFTFGDAVSDLEYLESGECSPKDIYHKATKHPEHVIRWLYDVPQGKSAHDNVDPTMRPPSGFCTTYKRQIWSEPGSTITTNFSMISGANNVHPIATRALTLREALRIQSFPDSFKFTGTNGVINTVVGNAVPPLLGYNIAKYIKEQYKL